MERSNARYVYHGVRRIVTVPFNYWHEPVWTSSAGLQFVRLISKYKDFIVRLNGFFSLQVTVLPLFRCFCNRREHRRPMMYENPQKELFLVMCKNIAQTRNMHQIKSRSYIFQVLHCYLLTRGVPTHTVRLYSGVFPPQVPPKR
jgi:hypothetical protein